ncbi:MAG: cellulase family glycosylhydrolase [Chitinophagaceae bacterium]|nr:cellulase family glycosylhydrolase [Chitinophagaceae bacterium]
MRGLLLVFVAGLFFFTACKKNNTSRPDDGNNSFVHAEGNLIKNENGNAITLRGVAFGNEVWSNKEVPATHHNEADYQRLKDMHMNAVRFYLNYKTFESDNNPYSYKQTGWDWIDQNVAWAKKYGVFLILNMHYPQGGYQSAGTGDALWNVVENQNRLTALWAAIAKRYKDEPTIIGFGLVNEPIPVSSLQQWKDLAQRITTEIRKEDKNHIVFLERPIYIKSNPPEDANLNFPMINDDNVVYEFHDYDPHPYTHQLFDWTGLGDGGKYPDESIFSYTNGSWYTATFNNPKLAAGTTNWTHFEGEKYKITDPKIKVGLPALVGANVQGTVFFDDIEIKEFDENGNFTRTVIAMNLNNNNGWSYWSIDGSGGGAVTNNTGNSDNSSIFISGSTGDCNVSNYTRLFIPEQGYSYQINGYMKGENVAADSYCMLRIDFITTDAPILRRNKEYLRAGIKKFGDFSAEKNVPVYCGEFGAGVYCFMNDKGGIQWVNDMIDLLEEYNLHFTYHSYHESSFGLYWGDGSLPDPSNANQPLIDLFTDKLH